ncbi:21074_t:CDS:2 [Racocetra persica]|uniref:21074_t:CDS:1 n=1 Tax=Racocetra persica TaxID=160502 RepID=A0ACA9NPF4_9GLOM|nr:21074_t:CDS:2 [Racocetra persica]
MPYGEFEIINDEEVVLDVEEVQKKEGFFELTYSGGMLLAEPSDNIVQGSRGENYERFAIIGSDDRVAGENYGYGENLNIDFDYILSHEKIEELKSAKQGDIFQFTFNGFLEKDSNNIFIDIITKRAQSDNEEEAQKETIPAETEELRKDIFATLADLESGWENQEEENEMEGGEKKIIPGYKERLVAIDNPSFEELLKIGEEVIKNRVRIENIKYLNAVGEVVDEAGVGTEETDFPKYDPEKHSENEEVFRLSEIHLRAKTLKQVHDKLKNDFSIDIYQDEN